MFKPGSIRKIQVKNFVTYTYTELYPGPNLNMLIGPNGTGKSTMVAAIILGLGGNPKVVGRGSKLSEYVKHNCTEATINIYLQGDNETHFIKITRHFDIHDKSAWKLNNERVLLKNILEFIKQYNIQVDNLCQFLPQDRVQEFAKLNKQQLLNETQLALCRHDLIEKQEILVANRENHKNLQATVEKDSEKLRTAQEANLRLEGKVKNFRRKRKYLERIQDIERKTAWIQYEQLHEKLAETKKDINKATDVHEKYKAQLKPIDIEINQAKKNVTGIKEQNSNIGRSIRCTESSIKNSLEKQSNLNQAFNKIKDDTKCKLAVLQQRETEIEETLKKLKEMLAAQKQLINKCGNDEEVKQKLQKIYEELQKLTGHVRGLEDKKEELGQEKQYKNSEFISLQNEINRLENVKQQRLEYLRRTDDNAYRAVMWLRENKRLFKGEVYEPIMLELNVLDSRNAIYIENVIPRRDRVAFTCTEKDDMNLLIRYLRNEQNLTVNILHSRNTNDGLSKYQPTIPIEQLKRYGLYTYMHSLVTAPEPIMRYLCQTYHIHNIPIGNSNTNKFYEQIPTQIRVFFSDKQRYSVNMSRYTGAKSIRQNEISPDGGLSISLNILRLETVKEQTNELQNNFQSINNQIAEYDNQITRINEKVQKLREELANVRGLKQQIQTIESRIKAMQVKIEDMKRTESNKTAIEEAGKNKIQKVVKDMLEIQEEINTHFKSFFKYVLKNNVNELKIENARKFVAYLENKCIEIRRLCNNAELTLNQIRDVYANIKGQARAALQKAKNISNGCTPDDEGFKEFLVSYNSLSNDIQQLQIEKDELLTKIDCLNTADNNEMREYETRLELIEKLQTNIEKSHTELTKLLVKMDQLQEDWLTPLNELINEINVKFSNAFERMGCAGEVSLSTGDNDKEYSQYGLSIKVTYRNGEPLQELNNIIQSGGERAVATAAFMLSLQELTPVPFRCVDEINQGMDSNNERRIFELLVDSTSQVNTSQYFLITPKLVPNLKFSRTMMVHIVHNGPFIEQDRKWSFSKLCNPQGVRIG